MNTILIFLLTILLLGTNFFYYQIEAQNSNSIEYNKYIAGVQINLIQPQKHNTTFPETILDTIFSFPSPGTFPDGLAWDGQYLWNFDYNYTRIYKLTPTGDVITSFPIPNTAGAGGDLVWDGSYLWFVDEQAALLFKIDTTTGLAINQFQLPSFGRLDPNGYGLAWDGEYLWHSEYYDPAMIYKLNPQNGQIISSFTPPKNHIMGITWVNGYLYGIYSEYSQPNQFIYKFDPTSGVVVDSAQWEVPYPLGLIWDGQYFWNVSSNSLLGGNERIYQVSNPISAINNKYFSVPIISVLLYNYPNPFNPKTTIEYVLAQSGQVELDIYNLLGQKIIRLVNNHQNTGSYKVTWNGLSTAGQQVASGVYIYELKIEQQVFRKKMMLLR